MTNFLEVKAFSEKHDAFPIGGLRSAIFYKGAELERAGAIARMGRKVLINEEVFLSFVAAGGLRNIRGAA